MISIYCCSCEKDVIPVLKNGFQIYRNESLSRKLFYQCVECRNYVGCHKGTKKPFGCIPTEQLRFARRKIHEILDPLYKNEDGTRKKGKRSKIYKLMSKRLGYEYHTGDIITIEHAREVYKVVLSLKKGE